MRTSLFNAIKKALIPIALLLASSTGNAQPAIDLDIPPIINPPIEINPDLLLRFPDLIVEQFRVVGRITKDDNLYKIPVLVRIKNQGRRAAGIFKVSTRYTHRSLGSTNYAVSFSVPGESNGWYPYTDSNLGSNQTVTFRGTVFYRNYRNFRRIKLTAIADSCSGDEFMPEYCRVSEFNENNNTRSIYVTLP